MKALVKAKAAPGLWLEEVAKPSYHSNDVLIRIMRTAICGTDLHIYQWDEWAQSTIQVPMVVGHEFVGEIVGVGDQVQGFAVGDIVSGEGHLTCGCCRNCRAGKRNLCRNTQGLGVNTPGAFAQWLTLPQQNVFKVPQTIEDNVAAIFDPLGNATHTALTFDLGCELANVEFDLGVGNV